MTKRLVTTAQTLAEALVGPSSVKELNQVILILGKLCLPILGDLCLPILGDLCLPILRDLCLPILGDFYTYFR